MDGWNENVKEKVCAKFKFILASRDEKLLRYHGSKVTLHLRVQ
jgi:hypothetical protein